MVMFIANELRDQLGDWVAHRLAKGVVPQQNKAEEVLYENKMTNEELQEQWNLERQTQIKSACKRQCIRFITNITYNYYVTDTPAQLRKGLANILALQGQIGSIETELTKIQMAIKHQAPSPVTLKIVQGMEEYYNLLSNQVDALYGTLNVTNEFPDIKGASIEFLQTLFLARDLKANIRKRAIGSFYEWDRLDQAVGGKANPLGA